MNILLIFYSSIYYNNKYYNHNIEDNTLNDFIASPILLLDYQHLIH